MAAKRITHLGADERKAHGEDARGRTPPSSRPGLACGGGSARPRRVARRPERHAGAGPGAGTARAHDGVAVHVLSGRGEGHGCRSEGHPDCGIERSALRRRPPFELRPVCVAGTKRWSSTSTTSTRHFRAVRVRREAHGRELTIAARNNGFGKSERAHHAGVGDRVPRGDGAIRRDADDGHLVPRLSEADLMAAIGTFPETKAGVSQPKTQAGSEGRREGGEDRGEGRREGTHPRQPRRAVQARRARRRSIPHRRQPPIVVSLFETGERLGMSGRSDTRHAPRSVPRLSGDAAGRSSSPARAVRSRRRRPQGGGGRQCRHARLHRPAPGPRSAEDPLFLQVKEATASVLEDHLPKTHYRQPGERVVQGQRMMQAASDIFLGWTQRRRSEPVPVLASAAAT